MAAQRGGRRRAAKQDVFRDALVAALADHLDVGPDRLSVSVTLDDEVVGAEHLPANLELVGPVMDRGDDQEVDVQDVVEDGAEEAPVAAVRSGRSGRSGRPGGEQSAESANGSGREDRPAPSRAPERENVAVTPEELDEEAEAAADLLEGLLDAMDLPGDLRISVQDAHAEVEVVGLEEGVLIGRRGQTLDAVQELVRTAMQRRFERRSRVLVDVDGYRARRMEKLLERADEAVEEVLATGEPQRLEPMDAIERRLVHQRVAETAGVVSNSHGREPSRRIVIEPAD